MTLTEEAAATATAINPVALKLGLDARMIPIAEIMRSPYNTRRIFDEAKLAELARSIRENGIVEPLIVRPEAVARYELVAGERRFRAAKLAGLTEVPCVIRELTYEQTLDQQLLENVQREDLHPLEEAAGFEQRRAAGANIEQIAKITGKDRSHVSRRLQLLKLIPEAQEVFLKGGMIPKHALQIARLPENEQPKAFLYVMTGRWDLAEKARPGEAFRLKEDARACESPAQLARFIESVVMRPLSKAPWSKKDAALVPEAGACNTCTKRTGGTNALLFEDGAPKDERCLDGECYENKFQAHLVQLQTKSAGKGEQLTLLSRDQEYKEWKEADGEKCGSEVKGLLKDGHRRGEKIRVCRDKKCRIHWGRSGPVNDYARQARAAQDKARIERQYRGEVWKQLAAAVKNPTLDDLRAVALSVWSVAHFDLQKAYADSIGVEAVKGQYSSNYEKPVSKLLAAMKTSRELLVWMALFTLFRDVYVSTHQRVDTKDELHQAAERHGVDAKNIRKEVDAEWQQKRDKKLEKAKAKKSKEKTKGKNL